MKYQIRIPVPCGENWNKMSPAEQGRFCGVCEKEVIDFTNKTDAELLAFIQAGARSCGRFKKTQLEQTYVALEPMNFWHRYLKYGLVLGLGFLGLSGRAQDESNDTIVLAPIEDDIAKKVTYLKNKILIKGIVVDSLKRPLIGVSIIEKGTFNGVTTDLKGEFELPVSSLDSSILVVSYVGFTEQEVFPQNENEFVGIVLEEEVVDVVGITVGLVKLYEPEKQKHTVKSLPKKTLWQRFKGMFKKNK